MEPTSRVEELIKGKDVSFLGSRIEKLIASLNPSSGGESVDISELTALVNDIKATLDDLDLSNFVKKVLKSSESHIQTVGNQIRSQDFSDSLTDFPIKTGLVKGWRLGYSSGNANIFFEFGITKNDYNNTIMAKLNDNRTVFTVMHATKDGVYRRIAFDPGNLSIRIYEGGTSDAYLVKELKLMNILMASDISQLLTDVAIFQTDLQSFGTRLDQLAYQDEVLETMIKEVESRLINLEESVYEQ